MRLESVLRTIWEEPRGIKKAKRGKSAVGGEMSCEDVQEDVKCMIWIEVKVANEADHSTPVRGGEEEWYCTVPRFPDR